MCRNGSQSGNSTSPSLDNVRGTFGRYSLGGGMGAGVGQRWWWLLLASSG